MINNIQCNKISGGQILYIVGPVFFIYLESWFLRFLKIDVVCSFAGSPRLVDALSVFVSSRMMFLGLRWAPAPFRKRSVGWLVLPQVVHFGYFFQFPTFVFRISWLFAVSASQSWIVTGGKQAVTRMCCFWAVGMVGTGMSSTFPPQIQLVRVLVLNA